MKLSNLQKQIIESARDLHEINLVTTSCQVKELHGKKKVISSPPWRDLTLENCLNRLVPGNFLAILTGRVSGITVIDIDCKKPGEMAEDGVEKWHKLIEQHGEPVTWKAKTGNGGYHYYFKYDEAVLQTSKLKIDGVDYTIDIRNDGGMIYAPPSAYKSKRLVKRYTWERSPFETPLATMPEFLKELFQPEVDTNLPLTMISVNASISSLDPHRGKDHFIKDLLNILDHQQAQHYQRWLSLGILLFNEYQGSNVGYQIWTDYLKEHIPAASYDEDGCSKLWRNCRKECDKRLSIRTLYYYAKNDNPKKFEKIMDNQLDYLEIGRICDPSHAVYIDDLIDIEFTHDFEIKQFMIDTIAYIFNKCRSYYVVKSNDHQYTEVPRQQLISSLEEYAKYLPEIKPFIKYTECRFLPYASKIPPILETRIFNTFQGFKVHQHKSSEKDTSADLELILHHIKYVYCSSQEDVYNYLIRWFAHLIQKPDIMTGVCLQMYSEEGAGKGIFLDWFCKSIIGSKYTEPNCDLNAAFGRFNSIVRDKLLIVCNELKEKEAYKYADTMKRFITESSVILEQKGVDAVSCQNYSNWILCSNNKYTVKLGLKDRRILCLELDDCYVGNYEYFDELHRALNNDSAVALYDHLMAFDLSGWNIRNIPLTKMKRDIINRSKSPIQVYVDSIFEQNHKLETAFKIKGKTYIFIKDFYEDYNFWRLQNNCKNTDPLHVFKSNVLDYFKTPKYRQYNIGEPTRRKNKGLKHYAFELPFLKIYVENESFQHLKAKEILQNWLNFYYKKPTNEIYLEFPLVNRKCEKKLPYSFKHDDNDNQSTYYLKNNISCPSYAECIKANDIPFKILDVAILHEFDLLYGFEICYKHPVPDDKKKELLEKVNSPVYEIDAYWILIQDSIPSFEEIIKNSVKIC